MHLFLLEAMQRPLLSQFVRSWNFWGVPFYPTKLVDFTVCLVRQFKGKEIYLGINSLV